MPVPFPLSIRTTAAIIGKKRLIIQVPPSVGYITGKLIGKLVGDVTVTREEIEGLMGELLYVDAPPPGKTKLTDWVKEHANTLGKKYTSEMARRKNRNSVYNSN